jgi:hypothetical protein
MSKIANFNTFKSIAGITFVLAFIIAFINILSEENRFLISKTLLESKKMT